MAFENKFFPKISKKIREKNFEKKIFQKNFFEKILCVEKNILFCKIFESHFSENEIFEN